MKDEIRAQLLSMGERDYKAFSSRLMPTVDESTVIGIRIPLLRRYARTLSDYDDFLEDLPHVYFEENNLHAFLIERETDFDRCVKRLDEFLPFVDNWATCDSLKPKVFKKEPEKLMVPIQTWINSPDVYAVRYGIQLLMSFYLEDRFDETILQTVANVTSDEYYINMMRAWFFATALAKQYEHTLPYLENDVLDTWTHNKTIQKAVESLRITDEQKAYVRTLKKRC